MKAGGRGGWRKVLRQAKHRLVNLLMPPRCLSCGLHVDRAETVCTDCWNDLSFISGAVCISCGTPMPESASAEAQCLGCLETPPPYAKARAALYYDAHVMKLISRFKYHDQLHLAPLLVRWMEAAGGEMIAKADMIAPVPLHWTRLLSRKYNQAAILAQGLARSAGRLYMPQLLKRGKRTKPQAALTKQQRKRNVQGAFTLHPRWGKDTVSGKIILLIDDVMTTGATISACARALKKAGAKKVWVLTLARTVIGE